MQRRGFLRGILAGVGLAFANVYAPTTDYKLPDPARVEVVWLECPLPDGGSMVIRCEQRHSVEDGLPTIDMKLIGKPMTKREAGLVDVSTLFFEKIGSSIRRVPSA